LKKLCHSSKIFSYSIAGRYNGNSAQNVT
jgi:hypothetical protein